MLVVEQCYYQKAISLSPPRNNKNETNIFYKNYFYLQVVQTESHAGKKPLHSHSTGALPLRNTILTTASSCYMARYRTSNNKRAPCFSTDYGTKLLQKNTFSHSPWCWTIQHALADILNLLLLTMLLTD